MKKFVVAGLSSAIVVAGLTACGQHDDGAQPSGSTAVTTTPGDGSGLRRNHSTAVTTPPPTTTAGHFPHIPLPHITLTRPGSGVSGQPQPGE